MNVNGNVVGVGLRGMQFKFRLPPRVHTICRRC